jgi:hypothetical protein
MRLPSLGVRPRVRPRRRLLLGLCVTGLFALFTVWMTSPLAWRAGSAVFDADDAYFNIWRISWVAHQLPLAPAQLFDANIFHPAPHVLTGSDAMLLPSLLGAPALWLGAHPVLVSNALLLLAILTSGVGAYVLAQRLAGDRRAAVLAGVIFAFAPYRVAHSAHLELQWVAWMPLGLWALHRLVEHPRVSAGLFLGAFVALQGLSSIYYVVFFCVYISVIFFPLMSRADRRQWRQVIQGGALAAVVAASVLLPYARSYWSSARDARRTTEEVARFSATVSDYGRMPPWNVWHTGEEVPELAEERSLYPGAIALGLAALAFWPPLSRNVIVYAVGLGLAFDASLGLNGHVFPAMRAALPFVGSLRAPARFSVLFLLSLAVLASLSTARLLARLPGLRGHVLGATLVFACLVEYNSTPMPLREPVLRPRAVERWLADRPPGTVVLQLPVPDSGGLWLNEATFEYLSIFHWQRLVNGYSGFAPDEYLRTLAILRSFPDEPSVPRLRELSVDYVVVYRQFLPPARYGGLTAALAIHPAFEGPVGLGTGVDEAAAFHLRRQ